MSFASRPPSTGWEPVMLPGPVPGQVWVWFKPMQAPQSLILKVPPEVYQALGPQLTMRRLLTAAATDPAEVDTWTVQGMAYPAQGGLNPLLDLPVPPPAPWGDPGVAVIMRTAVAAPFTSPPALAPSLVNAGTADLMEAFEADWQALLLIERQLEGVRKQLGAIQGRLQSLNRDLSPDERRHADNQDNKDWQDARRWLRDASAQVSRYIRDHDIGMVSAAGNRNRFEKIYTEHIVPRSPCEGLMAIQREFEQHRKTAQSLLLQMQAAHANAGRDGVQRAQQVLGRIAAKVRNARSSRS